jgi:hypothetical protein
MLSLPHLVLKLLLITMPSRMTHRSETKYNVTTECAFLLPFTSNPYATLTIHPYSPALISPFIHQQKTVTSGSSNMPSPMANPSIRYSMVYYPYTRRRRRGGGNDIVVRLLIEWGRM